MKANEVPQDSGLYEGRKSICYALGVDGRYVLVPSEGWEPLNIANDVAWETIRAELEETLREVHNKQKSPLAYHMVLNQMSTKLMSQYVRLPRWRIRRHLRWRVFERLDLSVKTRYARALGITLQSLLAVPPSQGNGSEG